VKYQASEWKKGPGVGVNLQKVKAGKDGKKLLPKSKSEKDKWSQVKGIEARGPRERSLRKVTPKLKSKRIKN